MKILNKRGKWVVREPNGKIHKFNTETEARIYAGIDEQLWLFSNEDTGSSDT